MNSAPNVSLPELGLAPHLPTGDFLTLTLYVLLLVYIVFTGVLYYHWHAYGSSKSVTLATFVVYFVITLPLLLTMATTAATF